MADTDSLDAFERMLVEALPPRELKWASEFLSELRNLRLRARSLESQLAESQRENAPSIRAAGIHDAPVWFDAQEAAAWAEGFNACRDHIRSRTS